MFSAQGAPDARAEFKRFATPRDNRLLAALPAADLEQLRPMLTLVEMGLGEVLFESEARLRWVHFPVSGVVSLLYPTPEGASAQHAVVGDDGFVGVAALLGGAGAAPRMAVVHIPGYAYRMKPEIVRREFQRRSALRDLLLRYIQARITLVSQLAACNRHHSLEQRFCRWLLQVIDRVGPTDIPVTQELISEALAVRRASVTHAGARLEAAGMVERGRGRITVRDRARLEERACECYAVMKNEYQRLLPAPSFPR